MARPRNKPVEQRQDMEVKVAVQRGPMGRTLHTEQVAVPSGAGQHTSTRVTVTTDVGPVELTVWPDGTTALNSRKAPAGTHKGRKIYRLWGGNLKEGWRR